MKTAIDNLKILRAVAHSVLPAEVADWLAPAIDEYVSCGGASSLDALLGLSGRGIRKLETRRSMDERDAALLDAYHLLPDVEGESDTTRRERLAYAIRNFEANKLPRLLGAREPIKHLSLMDAALFKAFDATTVNHFPRTASALYKCFNRLPNTPAIHSNASDAHCIITRTESQTKKE